VFLSSLGTTGAVELKATVYHKGYNKFKELNSDMMYKSAPNAFGINYANTDE